MPRVFVTALVIASGAIVLSPSFAGRAHASSPPPLDPTRLALFGGTRVDLREAGVEGARTVAWPIAGWTLVELPGEQQSPERVRALVDRLARDPDVGFAAPVFVGGDGGPLFPTQHILAGFEGSISKATRRERVEALGALSIEDEGFGGMPDVLRLRARTADGFELLALCDALTRTSGVRFAEPDWVFTGRGGHIPDDPGFADCWGLHNVGQAGGTPDADLDAPEAWDETLGDSSILVVVIDTGVQQDHPDIHQLAGADWTSDGPGNGGPVNGWDNHGTPVAGCVSATIDNALGTVGVAPGCRSASARTFISINSSGNWTSQASWTVDALAWAESIGARVTNNSNLYGFTSSAIETKYQQTRDAGIAHFASAGNNGTSSIAYPASLPSVEAIGAIDRSGVRAGFSNFGSDLAFAVPGDEIYTTDRTGSNGWSAGDYVFAWGTSFASPYCAGVAALALSVQPGLDVDGVLAAMRLGAQDLGTPGFDDLYGWGLPSAAGTLANSCGAQRYCSSSANSTGFAAFIDWGGSTSVAANDLVLYAVAAVPNQFGLFFYGPGETQTPFGNGFLCITPPLFRLAPPIQLDALGTAERAVDLTQPPADAGPGQIVTGSTWRFQFWFRDPAAGGAAFNLTDGLRARFCP